MYRELLLDNTKIKQIIKDFFNKEYNNVQVESKNKPNNSGFIETRYNVEFDGKKLFLTIFINSKGKTTLKVKEGKLQDIKVELAEYIKENCKIQVSKELNKSMVFKKINFSEFEKVLELIKEEEFCKEIKSIKENFKEVVYKLKGKYNDVVTITYNKNTHNIRIQGLPLLLYNLCVSYMNELIDVEEVIQNLEDNFNQNVSPSIIEEQFKYYLPYSSDKHTDKLKKSLLKSVYNLNVDSQEYTCTELVFEVLRALEGHVKITLSRDYDVTSSSVFGNLDMFTYDYENNKTIIKTGTKSKILRIKDRVEYYEKAYKHIVLYRHKYFHWDFPDAFGNDGTVQIDNIDDAKNLIKDTLKIIDEYYAI
ncbi:MAG: hypothetical protein GX962_04905 [Epulopiscium sp.]|nr:hypothetical protein [Candidatus Epulonipiscium sp.]